MIKKISALLLAILIILSFAACGKDKDKEQAETISSQVDAVNLPNTEKTGEEIRFEPAYVVLDDENAKVEITKVSATIKNKGRDEEFTEYEVHLTITNKSEENDFGFNVSTDAAAIGAYTVQFGNSDTRAKAGRINDTCTFSAYKYTNLPDRNTKGAEHIESIDDLLKFNADVGAQVYQDDGSVIHTLDRYKVKFSLEDVDPSTIIR